MKYFKASRSGKWILTGEHSVLLGVSALVFPLPGLFLNLSFSSDEEGIPSQEEEACTVIGRMLSVVKEYGGKDVVLPKGKLRVESSIPMSAGLGSSAAFCSCFGEFLVAGGHIEQEKLYELSRRMECVFHGESSGMDLSVILANKPIDFQLGRESQEIFPAWEPKLFLTDTGIRSNTSDCVKKVLSSRAQHGVMSAIDRRMGEASRIAKGAIEKKIDTSFRDLAEAINLANTCFEEWQLSTPEIKKQIEDLKKIGAKAVKPTGSGEGGFLLSLWEEDLSPSYNALPVFPRKDSSLASFPTSVWEINL